MSRLLVACICFFALSASTRANEGGNDEEVIRRGNDYIDQMLWDMFESDKREYDPYLIDDSVIGFGKKMLFVNVSGEAKLHDGNIKGLRTLHRPNDCSMHNDGKNGERVKVKADLGAGVLDFHYSGSAKFMNFGPSITVKGNLAYIEVHLEFTVDAKTGKNGKLTKFVIDDMRGIKVWVTGLGPINWALNPIISAVTKIFKRFVTHFLQNKVERYIANHIPNYQFPVERGGETETPLTEPPKPETTRPTEPPKPETTRPTEPPKPETTQPTEPETPAPEEKTQPSEPETVPEETTQPSEPETVPEETTQPSEPETVPEEVTQIPEPETARPEEPDDTI